MGKVTEKGLKSSSCKVAPHEVPITWLFTIASKYIVLPSKLSARTEFSAPSDSSSNLNSFFTSCNYSFILIKKDSVSTVL